MSAHELGRGNKACVLSDCFSCFHACSQSVSSWAAVVCFLEISCSSSSLFKLGLQSVLPAFSAKAFIHF